MKNVDDKYIKLFITYEKKFSSKIAVLVCVTTFQSYSSPDSKNLGQWMGPIWQAQLGESLVILTGPSWAPKFIALLGTKFGAHL